MLSTKKIIRRDQKEAVIRKMEGEAAVNDQQKKIYLMSLAAGSDIGL